MMTSSCLIRMWLVRYKPLPNHWPTWCEIWEITGLLDSSAVTRQRSGARLLYLALFKGSCSANLRRVIDYMSAKDASCWQNLSLKCIASARKLLYAQNVLPSGEFKMFFNSTTQGLVRNAAALSNWTHFCAQSLAADVQELEIETKFLGFGALVSVLDVFPISSSWGRCLRTTGRSFPSHIFTPLLCGTNQGAWITNWLGTSGRLRCYVSDFAFFSAMTAARRSCTSTLQGVVFEP